VRLLATEVHNRWHPDLEPVATVRPGEEVTFETRDGLDGQLTRASTHESVGSLNLGLGHPLTGPTYIEDAEPGNVLEVEFIAYEPDDFGTTAVIPGFGFLSDLFTEPYLVKWEIAGGLARSDSLPGVAVPEDTFAGVVGVAPSHARLETYRSREEELRAGGQPVADSLPEAALPATAADGIRTIPPRETGGNLDVRQLVSGSKLWLPVDVPGALFSIGDLHFAQGDGEVCGTAIEVGGTVTVRFAVHDVPAPTFPAYETPGDRRAGRSFATVGIPVEAGMDLNAAARAALLEMIAHLERRYGFERPAAYALCSACVDLRISEVVDVPYPLVSALLPLDVFEPDPAGV
jgi:formamidase